MGAQQVEQVVHIAQELANILHATGRGMRPLHQGPKHVQELEQQLPVEGAQLSFEVCIR